MHLPNALLSILCLVGHVMGQMGQETSDSYDIFDQFSQEGAGRFYRSQFDRGSGGSRDIGLGGRTSTAEFFNSNLQLDNVAQFRGSSPGLARASSSLSRGFDGPMSSRGFGGSRRGQGIQEDPIFIRRLLGSTVIGREMRMGERGLPRHGGAGIGEQYADGRNNGWDGNPQTLTTQYQSSWSDPFQGRPIPQLPIGFNGDFGSVRGMFGSMGLPPFRVPGQFLYLKHSDKMKLFLQTFACFVFVSAVFGQGYQGRQRKPKPIPKKPLHTDGFDPFATRFDNGLDGLRGRALPEHIRRIIGSTINGEMMIGGMNGLPRHGGTLNEDGIVNGWGADPNEPMIPAVQMWQDPLKGADFPIDYRGQDFDIDPRLNRIVIRPDTSVGHQITKQAHVAGKTGGIIGGGVPSSHKSVKTEHNMVKQANHVQRKTLGGVIGGIGSHIGVDPISHNIDKQISATGRIGSQPFGPTVNRFGTINAGDITVDDPRVIARNIAVATLGADAVAGHNIAKNSGTPVIRGFINPSRSVHNTAKASGLGATDPFGVGIGSLGQVAHGNMKMSHGQHIGVSDFGPLDTGINRLPLGVLGKTADPVHNVNKVGQSGVAGIGHDPLAASLGHGLAKQAIGEAADVINMGSRGGIAAGDPIAIAAKVGLARESLNVADKTVALATSGVAGHGGIGAGMDIFGQKTMIHPQPVKKPPPKFPTRYIGRRRQ